MRKGGAAAAGRLEARAWVVWTAAAAILITLTRNPVYLLVILLAVSLVAATWQRQDSPAPVSLVRLGLFILVFSTLFNIFFVHIGDTVLLKLPAGWPLIGGIFTLESAAVGALNGLMLLSLLALFLTFNGIVPASDLVTMTPRAFHSLGLVVLLALTYVPETQRHWQRIREAQAIRGHRLQGWRAWQPVILPLLIGGLERALALAEAMVARGYGAAAGARHSRLVQALLLAGLAGVFAGWLLSFSLGWRGWLVMAMGSALLAGVIWQLGRGLPPRLTGGGPWTWREAAVGGGALVPLALAWALGLSEGAAPLFYSPYPRIAVPPIDPVLLASLALFAFPALLGRDRRGKRADD